MSDELLARVQEYLSVGGLFNPEAMHPQISVRDLIIDLSDHNQAQAARIAELEADARELWEALDRNTVGLERIREKHRAKYGREG